MLKWTIKLGCLLLTLGSLLAQSPSPQTPKLSLEAENRIRKAHERVLILEIMRSQAQRDLEQALGSVPGLRISLKGEEIEVVADPPAVLPQKPKEQ